MSELRKYKVLVPFRVGGKLLKVGATVLGERITASEARGLVSQKKLELVEVKTSRAADNEGGADEGADSSKDKK
jgi:hypothetical protein